MESMIFCKYTSLGNHNNSGYIQYRRNDYQTRSAIGSFHSESGCWWWNTWRALGGGITINQLRTWHSLGIIFLVQMVLKQLSKETRTWLLGIEYHYYRCPDHARNECIYVCSMDLFYTQYYVTNLSTIANLIQLLHYFRWVCPCSRIYFWNFDLAPTIWNLMENMLVGTNCILFSHSVMCRAD